MATLSIQYFGTDGTVPTMSPADSAGDTFKHALHVFVHVENKGGSSVTVTIPAYTDCSHGFRHDAVVTVPAGDDRFIGPFAQHFLDELKNIDISYSSVLALAAPTGLTATASTTGGSLATATYYYKVTALSEYGETVGSTEASAAVTGPTGSVALSWTAVSGAASYRIYRGTTSNGQSVYYTSTSASYTDTGAASTAGTVPTSGTASRVGVAVLAV